MPETLACLLTIARAVSATTDLTETLRLTCRELSRLTLAETVSAYLLDAEGEEVRPVAAYHVPKHALELLTKTTLPVAAQGFAESVFTAGRVAWSDDVQNDPRFAFPLFRVFPHRSGLVIPLQVDGPVAGAFYLVWWLDRESPGGPRVAKIVAAAERIRDIVNRMAGITRVEVAQQSSGNLPPMLDIKKSGNPPSSS